MNEADLDKLTKLLALTASDIDGEALAAIRAANRLLSRNKIRWEAVLAPKETPHKQQPWERHDQEIETLFDDAFAKGVTGSFGDFLKSLYSQWETKRSLSPKQMAALRKAARRE